MADPWLTANQIYSLPDSPGYLNICRATYQKWVNAGLLPPGQVVGGTRFTRQSDIDLALEEPREPNLK